MLKGTLVVLLIAYGVRFHRGISTDSKQSLAGDRFQSGTICNWSGIIALGHLAPSTPPANSGWSDHPRRVYWWFAPGGHERNADDTDDSPVRLGNLSGARL